MTTISRPGRWIGVVLLVLGSIGGLLALGAGVLRGVAAHGPTSGSWSVDAQDVEALRITSSAADVEVVFGDVDEATLAATSSGGPVGDWSLERDGATLVVDRSRGWGWLGRGARWMHDDAWGEGSGWGDGGWGGMRGLGGDEGRGTDERALLTLPAALEDAGIDLLAEVRAGTLEAGGGWGVAEVDLQGGAVDLVGTADELRLDVAAGEARLDLEVAGVVDLDVSAGRVVGALTGTQPEAIAASVSAGSVELDVPAGDYAVTEDVAAGRASILVDEDPRAASTIDVDVAAGNVTIRGGSR